MKVIVCVDDKDGMMFANRRQSRDRELIKDVLAMCEKSKLWITPYSLSLFEGEEDKVVVDEQMLDKAENEDYCFVETKELANYEDNIQQLIVYHWNRVYPSDQYFDIEYQLWNLIETEEIKGYSHEKITREVYER